MLSAKPVEELYPLAADPAWREFKLAYCHLLVRRASERGTHELGDAYDRDLLERLAGLSPAPHDRAHVEASLCDAGHDVGRQVYARRVLEDSFSGAIALLSTSLGDSGLGRLHAEDVFHRAATVRFAPSPRAAHADPAALLAFVAGVLAGFFSEAFNCRAHVGLLAPATYRVRLGSGRDVNREGPGRE